VREGQVRAHLVKRVKEVGGEIRKVQWVGRKSAPDELVMLPAISPYHGDDGKSVFVELKATGLAATFPNDAHERMRKFGLRVVVIDSIEGVEELLR
jgi:hypothetical protein